jgi:hypothetical protein
MKKKTGSKEGKGVPAHRGPSRLVDAKNKELRDWRGETLARVRAVIRQADPDVVEEVKWRKPSNPAGVPAWSHDGIICTGETYKDKVKLTFARGASLADPSGLFNASVEGNTRPLTRRVPLRGTTAQGRRAKPLRRVKGRRAIDIHEGEKIDERALKALIRAAVALNTSLARTARGRAPTEE